MKNISFSKKSLLFLSFLSISLFLATPSTVSAAAATVASEMGRPQVIHIDLYQTDTKGNIISDSTTPSGYAYNELDLYLGSWTARSIGFSAVPLTGSNGIEWTLDNNITWTLVFLNQDPVLGYALTYNNSSLDSNFIPNHQSLLCSFKAAHPGVQQIRVTSPNGGDNGESVAYTMTIIIDDNSPAPKLSPTPTPAPQAVVQK